MISFSLCLVILVVGYFAYGKVVDRVFGVDADRPTPAYTCEDGIDFVPIPRWRVFLTQLMNIAGLGPIYGAILGAKFGTAAYLWITFGAIFIGGLHDYFVGMISLRNEGRSYPEIVGRYMGTGCMMVARVLTPLILVLIGTVFVFGSAELLTQLTMRFTNIWNYGTVTFMGKSTSAVFLFWAVVIFVYFMIATIFPIHKVVGSLHPFFSVAFFFMAAGLLFCLYYHMPAMPEFMDGLGNTHPSSDKFPIFPMMFITIACGALSGFHATQSPLMARCLQNEKQGKSVFFGSMIGEGIIALIWAAAANYVFRTPEGLFFLESTNAVLLVDFVTRHWLGSTLAVLVFFGVVMAPVTSGDTAFRVARLMIADALKMEQRPISKRLMITVPLFTLCLLLMFVDFSVVWRYFAWFNQMLGTIALWMVTSYLVHEKKNYWIALLPAAFMTSIVSAYMFVSPEMLGLNMWVGNIFGIVIAFMSVMCFFVWKMRLEVVKPEDVRQRIAERLEMERRLRDLHD